MRAVNVDIWLCWTMRKKQGKDHAWASLMELGLGVCDLWAVCHPFAVTVHRTGGYNPYLHGAPSPWQESQHDYWYSIQTIVGRSTQDTLAAKSREASFRLESVLPREGLFLSSGLFSALPTLGHLAISGDTLGYHDSMCGWEGWRSYLTFSGFRPKIYLPICVQRKAPCTHIKELPDLKCQ
jgi:hypothetical protein